MPFQAFFLSLFLYYDFDIVAINNLFLTDSVTGDFILRHSYSTFWNEYTL